jgi:hypothetical protein
MRNTITFDVMPVDAFAVCGNNLFVGGQFTTAGNDTNAHGIAIWDGSNWHGMNGGPGVNTSYISPDGSSGVLPNYWPPVTVTTISAHGHDVYVGGNFSYVANEETNAMVTVDSTSDRRAAKIALGVQTCQNWHVHKKRRAYSARWGELHYIILLYFSQVYGSASVPILAK